MARSRLGVGATTAALAALAVSSAGAAGAGAPAAPAPAAVQAAVFFVQMAPSAVDLSVDGTEVGPFAARTPSNFQFYEALVPAGKHTLQILPVGSATPGGSPLASVTATLTGGSDYSLVSYVDGSGKTQLSLLPFGNDPVPAGSARLVLRNTADSGPVDVYLNNAKVASALADNPAAPPTVSVVEPVGGGKLTVTPAGNASTVLVTQAISFAPAEVADIEVTGAQGSGSTASTLAAQGLFQFLPTGYWEAAGD
ncbi:MAG TPA: DUF4397 domain-containing protein, partial [Acidimicrobiales bacterium]|nr:DUF4397 domain-containing protein [Acidimicrobiales bacterium]